MIFVIKDRRTRREIVAIAIEIAENIGGLLAIIAAMIIGAELALMR